VFFSPIDPIRYVAVRDVAAGLATPRCRLLGIIPNFKTVAIADVQLENVNQ
jgi:hypothetical protein